MLTKANAAPSTLSNSTHNPEPSAGIQTGPANSGGPFPSLQWNGPARPTPQQILTLQRTIGNQAVQRLLANYHQPKPQRAAVPAPLTGHNPAVQRLITTNASSYMTRAIQVQIGASDFADYKAKKGNPASGYAAQAKHWSIELVHHLADFFRMDPLIPPGIGRG